MRRLRGVSVAAMSRVPLPHASARWTVRAKSLAQEGGRYRLAGMLLTALTLAGGNAFAIGFSINPTLPAGNIPSYYSKDIYLSGYVSGSTTTLAPAQGFSLPPGLALVVTGDQSHWVLGGVLTAPGNYSFKLNVTDSLNNSASQTFTLNVSALFVYQDYLNPASTQQPYNAMLGVCGGSPPYTWSSTSMPAGLNLMSNGQITGTPATPGGISFNVTVQDAALNTTTASLYLSISPVVISYTASGATILAAIDQPFSLTPLAFGPGPVTLSVGGYPPVGLNIDPNTGIISGTPVQSGLFNLTFNVTPQGGGATYSTNYDLFVQQAGFGVQPPFASTTAFFDQTVGLFTSIGLQVNSAQASFGPLIWSVASGTSLPPGLSLVLPNPTTSSAQLLGIPTTPGTYVFAVQVADSGGTYAQQTIRLVVSDMALVPGGIGNGICYPNLNATAGVQYQQQFGAIGLSGPTTFSIIGGALPGGMTLSPAGLIAGTSNDSTGSTVHIQATNGTQTFSRVCSIGVTNSAAPLPISINSYSYDPFINEGNPPLDLSVGYNSGLQFAVSGASAPVTWTFYPGSQIPPGMSLSAVSYNNGQNAQLSGAPTTPGYYTFTLQATGGNGQYGLRTFAIHIGLMTNPNWAENLYAGQTGVPYSAQIPVLFGTPPYTFALSPLSYLPPGLTLTPSGLITGIAASAGQFYPTYTVTDANGFTINNQITFNIVTPLQTWPLDNTQPPGETQFWDASVGVPFAPPVPLIGLIAQGIVPYTWSVTPGSTLPPGLNVDSVNILSGTPAEIGQYNFLLRAADGRGRTTDITIQMNVRQLHILQNSLAPGTTGMPYSQQLTGGGGTPPYSFTATYGLGCPGLTLSSSGLISGTPTQICSGLPTFVLTDALSNTFTRNFLIPIGPPGSATNAVEVSPGTVAVPWTIGNPAPSPIPIQVVATPAGLSFTASATGGSWIGVSPSSGTAPGNVNIVLNPPALVGVYSGTVTITVPSAYNSPVTLGVTLVVTSSSACAYSVSPGTNVLPAFGGTGSFSVNTQPYCTWTATASDPANVTVTSHTTGTGTGTVSYSVTANTGTTNRPFTITIPAGPLTYNIVQQGTACSFLTTPASLTAPPTGGPVTLSLSSSNAVCTWNVAPVPSWITVDPTTQSGTGGGPVKVAIALGMLCLAQ